MTEYEVSAAPQFLLAEAPEDQEVSEGGIIIAGMSAPTATWCKVVSVGEEVADHFLAGDIVLVRSHDAMAFDANGRPYVAIRHRSVMATKRG